MRRLGLALLLILAACGDATVTEPTEPEPQDGIYVDAIGVWIAVVEGEAPSYGFEVGINAYGQFVGTTRADVEVKVDGNPLELAEGFELQPADDGGWVIWTGGTYPETPDLGYYTVEVTDDNDDVWSFEVGQLDDIPEDAPHMLSPTHLTLTTDRMPTFGWEPFQSDYLGTPIDPWNYQVRIGSGNDEEGSHIEVIDPEVTSIAYNDGNWGGTPLPDDGLEPGEYSVTVHSDHEGVAPGFVFEHHRSLVLVVYSP